MKQTVRKNTFETNSSSSHSLVLFSDMKINLNEIKYEITNLISIPDEYTYRTSKDILTILWSLAVVIKQRGDNYYADRNFKDYTEILKNKLPSVTFKEIHTSNDYYMLDMGSRFLDICIENLDTIVVDAAIVSRDNYINMHDYFKDEMDLKDLEVYMIGEG